MLVDGEFLSPDSGSLFSGTQYASDRLPIAFRSPIAWSTILAGPSILGRHRGNGYVRLIEVLKIGSLRSGHASLVRPCNNQPGYEAAGLA
jgi:hypothetical protein